MAVRMGDIEQRDRQAGGVKARLNEVIFGYDTRGGQLFDLVLIALIIASVLAVMLDSVESLRARYHAWFYGLEWLFTLLFTAEYFLRLYSARSTRSYASSFFGIVDLLSILPTYLAFLFPGAQSLIVIRVLRVLRVFRILKLIRYMGEANILISAMLAARHKIFIFLFSVLTLMIIFGSVMFVVEGPENGFTSIPISIYWAVVTIATVGYGDIVPQTAVGQTIAVLAIITGYSIIAVPTGIIGSELINENQKRSEAGRDAGRACESCGLKGHDRDARFCKRCGALLRN